MPFKILQAQNVNIPFTDSKLPSSFMAIDKQIYGLTVLHPCGSGAYGQVYHCRDASGKEVALKIVSKAQVGSGWERELKGITHYRALAEDTPGLLKLYHVGEDAEALYYTMELADALPEQSGYKADTLAARLATGALPPEQLIATLSAILEGIRMLHEAGFAHRDIKPENILFIRSKPKLADLGLLSPLTGTLTQLAGTLDFLPPEARTGKSSSDRASLQRNDLYAFGKLIYCCLTGKGANEYPSAPPDMPLTLSNKLFFRLSMRLCDKEPTRRLNLLSELLTEFQQTVHFCQYGEGVTDKLCAAFSAGNRNLRSLAIRSWLLCRQHWKSSILGGWLFLAGCLWLGHYLAGRPDKESEELAQTLQKQKKIAATTDFTKVPFPFYNDRYSIAVPTDWLSFDHKTIVKSRLPGDVLAQRLYGLLTPQQGDGNADTVVSLMILPVTADQLSALSVQEKIETLKPFFADDVEAISIRQYRNSRLNLDTLLFTGEAQPSKTVVCYLYPQSDHTLCISALIPQEKFQTDMGTFLAITDSLVRRPSPENTIE